METLLKIEKRQRMLIEQISITKILDDYLDSFRELEITREELLERLEALSNTHLSIRKLDNLEIYINHIYSDWDKVTKTLLKTWINLEEQRLDKTLETGSVVTITTVDNDNSNKLAKSYRNLLLGSGLKPKDYSLEIIYKHKATELPPFFKRIDEVNLTFDENSTYDEISMLNRIAEGRNLNVDNLYLANQQQFTTNNFYFMGSRESLNKVFKDRADLTPEDLVRVKEIIRKQKRREMNIKFLYEYGFRLKKEQVIDKGVIKAMKKDRSFKLKSCKKAVEKLQKTTNIEGQVRALLGEWVIQEVEIIGIRCGYFEEELLANRYVKVFTKILKKDIVKYNIKAIYKEATSHLPSNKDIKLEKVDSEIFKSIANFKLLDEGLLNEIDETASINSGSSASTIESLRNQTSYSHARDLDLFDRPKPKLKLLQRIESFCLIS